MTIHRVLLGSTALVILGVFYYTYWFSAVIKTVKAAEDTVLKPCSKKFIIVTTQRSGSTWMSTQISMQDDVASGTPESRGGELMIQYNNQNAQSTKWEDYEKDLDAAFDMVCTAFPTKAIIGFKLMYNQLPNQFVFMSNPNESPFARYLQKNEISVIHLVREAGVLRLSSQYDADKQKHLLNSHALDESQIEELRNIDKLRLDSRVIEMLVEAEASINNYDMFLKFLIGVNYLRLMHENMVMDLETQLAQILTFLHLPMVNDVPEVRLTTTTFQLHETTCGERIENYDEFIHDARVPMNIRAACRMLQAFVDDQND